MNSGLGALDSGEQGVAGRVHFHGQEELWPNSRLHSDSLTDSRKHLGEPPGGLLCLCAKSILGGEFPERYCTRPGQVGSANSPNSASFSSFALILAKARKEYYRKEVPHQRRASPYSFHPFPNVLLLVGICLYIEKRNKKEC